jgi:hypothetical protein
VEPRISGEIVSKGNRPTGRLSGSIYFARTFVGGGEEASLPTNIPYGYLSHEDDARPDSNMQAHFRLF